MPDNGRFDVIFLGRKLGTTSGWDGDQEALVFYDFDVADGLILLPQERFDLQLDITNGIWAQYNDKGNQIKSGDIVPILNCLPIIERVTE